MSGPDIAQAMFVLLALILPLSALMARRGDGSRTAQLVLIWAAIFIIGVVIVRVITSVP